MRKRRIGNLFQTGDEKTQKHVPVIECPTTVTAGKSFDVTLTVGKEVPHPVSAGHHIRWMKLFFQPDDETTVYEVAGFEFASYGETVENISTGQVCGHASASVRLSVNRPGALLVIAYCNIHGLWENSAELGLL